MKIFNLILSVSLLFIVNISYSYDFTVVEKELGISEVKEEFSSNKYDYLLEEYKKNEDSNKIIEYINKSGFYKCNTLNILEKTDINKKFIDSCKVLLIDYKKSKAEAVIKTYLGEIGSDDYILNSYLGLMYALNGDKNNAYKYINIISKNEDLKIFTEYLKVLLNDKFNEKLLLEEEYRYKIYFLHTFLSQKRDSKDYTNALKFSEEALKHENVFFNEPRYEIFISLHQYIYMFLYDYYSFKKDFFRAQFYLAKIYEGHSESENFNEAKETLYDLYISDLLNKERFSFKDIEGNIYGEFVDILKENDKKIIILFFKLFKGTLGGEFPIVKDDIEEYINLFYCNDLNSRLKEKESFINLSKLALKLTYDELEELEVCKEGKESFGNYEFLKIYDNEEEIKLIENEIKLMENENKENGNLSGNNIRYIFIFLFIILIIGCGYYLVNRKNV